VFSFEAAQRLQLLGIGRAGVGFLQGVGERSAGRGE
jgi:hypothetical protein